MVRFRLSANFKNCERFIILLQAGDARLQSLGNYSCMYLNFYAYLLLISIIQVFRANQKNFTFDYRRAEGGFGWVLTPSFKIEIGIDCLYYI